MPTTRSAGRPLASRMTQTMTSSGLVMTMTKACGACCLMFSPTDFMTLALTADQIVAAHARLARYAGGDDDHIGPGQRREIVRAGHRGVEALDRRGLGQESSALPCGMPSAMSIRMTSPSSFQTGEQSQSPADLTGAGPMQSYYVPWKFFPSVALGRGAWRGSSANAARCTVSAAAWRPLTGRPVAAGSYRETSRGPQAPLPALIRIAADPDDAGPKYSRSTAFPSGRDTVRWNSKLPSPSG